MVISVSYEAMEESAGTMKTAADQILQAVQDLRGRLGALQWQGQDATAYEEVMAEMERDATECGEICGTIGQAVQTASENYQANEQANVSTWR